MLRNKKILFAAFAAILTIVFFTYQITAQNSGNDKHKNHLSKNPADWNNSNVPQKYWLSDSQINKINDIQIRYDDKIQPQIEKLYNLRDEAYQYGNRDNAEYKKVREYRNQINQLEEQIYNTRMQARNEIGNVLAKGQRPYYRNYAFNNWWNWDMDGWCNWDMDRYMMGDMYYQGEMHNNSGMSHRGCGCW